MFIGEKHMSALQIMLQKNPNDWLHRKSGKRRRSWADSAHRPATFNAAVIPAGCRQRALLPARPTRSASAFGFPKREGSEAAPPERGAAGGCPAVLGIVVYGNSLGLLMPPGCMESGGAKN